MKIHVLTLTWEGEDKLIKLRSGLYKNLMHVTHKNGMLKEGFEYSTWYIRDNGSKDNTLNTANSWKFLSDYPIETKVFDIGHNRDSFAQGMNYLFEQANPADDDLILLLNNDVIFNDNTSLYNMYNLMNKNKDIAVVGAKLLYTNTNKIQHQGVAFGIKYNYMPWHINAGKEADSNSNKNRYFQAVTAAVCLIKASEFRKAGMFDTNLKWAFDDIDLCLSIGQNNKIAYCGQTNIYHDESATLKKNPVNKLFLSHNVNYFKTKWSGKYIIDYDFYLNDPEYNVIR